MDYEPTKPVDSSSCILGVSGGLNTSCGAVALGITACQHEKRNSKNTPSFLIMLITVWHLGVQCTVQ